ncbi:hypothetical protein D6856_07595 [Butyrivibrio sp. XB500-5]|uniref:transglutaminase domain-containing protein n=1 Tax=Butyrivibrio sp. XB500-5 TaxID=2364880 RepID=UPI000EA84F26|nr:transglutaminase domain-containing protein [Butyrivibrio sp. XB500-5]RKM60904.1 hypothetical protein D6856_07595 [Butyrivibrio sp. XB500-5]
MKKKIVGIVLLCAVVLSACSSTSRIDESYEGGQNADSINAMVEQLDAQSGLEPVSESSETDENVLSDGSVSGDELELDESQAENYSDGEGHYLFNPHVFVASLYPTYPMDYWESFYKLVDALRSGEDTFECSSEGAFKWCTDMGVLGNLFPVATEFIKRGTYQDGKGTISYSISVDEFLEKEKAFEQDIEGILRDCVKTDYTDFEKCLAIYDYVAYHFDYNDDMNGDFAEGEGDGLFGTYNCFKNRSGICSGLAPAYAYLLMQCNIDAFTVGADNKAHAWVYLKLDGEGFFSDVTYAIPYASEGNLVLDYFLMNTKERNSSGFDVPRDLNSILIRGIYDGDFDYSSLTADSDKYNFFKYTCLENFDPEQNVVKYTNGHGELVEYKY